MQLLKDYFALQEQIYAYFGYKEDWCAIPLADYTEYYWFLSNGEEGSVVYYDEPFTEDELREEGGSFCSAEVYRQRFLSQWVYRAEDYTLVCADTRTDGNKFLMVFDNAMEQDNDTFRELYEAHWSPAAMARELGRLPQ